MFENLSLPHALMVIAIALLLFGPKKIPEIAGSMGKGIREFKKGMNELGDSRDGADGAEGDLLTHSSAADQRDRSAPKRLL